MNLPLRLSSVPLIGYIAAPIVIGWQCYRCCYYWRRRELLKPLRLGSLRLLSRVGLIVGIRRPPALPIVFPVVPASKTHAE